MPGYLSSTHNVCAGRARNPWSHLCRLFCLVDRVRLGIDEANGSLPPGVLDKTLKHHN